MAGIPSIMAARKKNRDTIKGTHSMPEVRLDRLATLHLGWPVSRMLSSSRNFRIPILMYHAVEAKNSGRHPYFETSVSPEVFARQIRQMKNEGYRSVGLADALAALESGEQTEKLVVITFDDGFRDFYEFAFPALSDCGFTATVFLISSFMDDPSSEFKEKHVLTWAQVRELRAAGISFGSHTATHPQLKLVGMARVNEEIETSKKTIEDRMGEAITEFSYPYAFPEADQDFRRQLRESLQRNGFEIGVTTILGTAHSLSDRFFLPRLPVNNWDDPRFFQAKLEGGYNWLHSAQYVSKLVGKLREAQS
jgi:peptidoglycan/xylan/chitin deacetylase (PgdA/CDA1 family)